MIETGTNSDFDAFVKREQAEAERSRSFDWAKERDEWLGYLKNLYETTQTFLADYIKQGEIAVSYRDIELDEENIGIYKARQMVLRIGTQEITLTPIGTLLIGTKGRVDIEGRSGRTRLILADRKSTGPRMKVTVRTASEPHAAVEPGTETIDWVWKIATSPPAVRYIELTRESLLDALLEVANG